MAQFVAHTHWEWLTVFMLGLTARDSASVPPAGRAGLKPQLGPHSWRYWPSLICHFSSHSFQVDHNGEVSWGESREDFCLLKSRSPWGHVLSFRSTPVLIQISARQPKNTNSPQGSSRALGLRTPADLNSLQTVCPWASYFSSLVLSYKTVHGRTSRSCCKD